PGVPPGAAAGLLAEPEPDRATVEVAAGEGVHPVAQDVRGDGGGGVIGPGPPGRLPGRIDHLDYREVPTSPAGKSQGSTIGSRLKCRNNCFTYAIVNVVPGLPASPTALNVTGILGKGLPVSTINGVKYLAGVNAVLGGANTNTTANADCSLTLNLPATF